ncbi:MAG: DegT/DnrJ/EryC1/StrS family aminotransferase [Clostridia bacterium]|nr:DegT/DnrJ/EryC1/StrS family aminotransferase [Clostridia bacterium]
MQFIDLKAQYSALQNEINENVQKVLDSAQFIGGHFVTEFEEQLAEYVGRKYCISCANGTDALTLALKAYGIGVGDAVFVPTFTFYASAETISLQDATPVFVDIDRGTFNISAEDLEKAVKDIEKHGKLTPKAVICVDLFGLPFEYEKIKKIADEHNLLLIEDAAQGFGGMAQGVRACALGDISTTSFFPAKPLGCYGDGGAVFTDEEKVKDYLESLKVHGKGTDKYDNIRIGLNSRLDALQAVVLQVKLKAFKEYELEERQKVSQRYYAGLNDAVKTPFIPDGYLSSYAQYSILLEDEAQRDRFQKHLKEKGIPTMIYYPKSMHQQTVYRNNPYIYRNFENAEYVSQRILNLPMHPYLMEEDQKRVIDAINEVM